MKPKIGFIGLGIMGMPMSIHLLKAGYEVIVYDIVKKAVEELITKGATRGGSCKDVAENSNIIISMVPDSPQVMHVALGEDGIINGVRQGKIYIDMSTISPKTAIEVARRLTMKGVGCLDAPVSGGQTGAENASLSIMVGGPSDIFNTVLPIFKILGKTVTLCGPNGSGQIVKACNQIQVAMNFIGMSEALVLGAKAGVNPEIIIKVLSGGYAQTRVMDVRGPRIVNGDFEPGFKSKFHYKDLNIILDTAKEYNCPLPVSALVKELFSALLSSGRGDLDHSAIICILEDLAKIKARTPNS